MGTPPVLWWSTMYFVNVISMHSKTRWIRPSQFSTSVSLRLTNMNFAHFTTLGWSSERSTEISLSEVLGMPSLLSSIFTFFMATISPV